MLEFSRNSRNLDSGNSDSDTSDEKNPRIIASVECVGDHITVRLDGIEAASLNDDTFDDGQVGMAFFGKGRAFFRDLQAEELK